MHSEYHNRGRNFRNMPICTICKDIGFLTYKKFNEEFSSEYVMHCICDIGVTMYYGKPSISEVLSVADIETIKSVNYGKYQKKVG
jgi:methionyl-tRNA formyltransferase